MLKFSFHRIKISILLFKQEREVMIHRLFTQIPRPTCPRTEKRGAVCSLQPCPTVLSTEEGSTFTYKGEPAPQVSQHSSSKWNHTVVWSWSSPPDEDRLINSFKHAVYLIKSIVKIREGNWSSAKLNKAE